MKNATIRQLADTKAQKKHQKDAKQSMMSCYTELHREAQSFTEDRKISLHEVRRGGHEEFTKKHEETRRNRPRSGPYGSVGKWQSAIGRLRTED